jgi:hypothetical protein
MIIADDDDFRSFANFEFQLINQSIDQFITFFGGNYDIIVVD